MYVQVLRNTCTEAIKSVECLAAVLMMAVQSCCSSLGEICGSFGDHVATATEIHRPFSDA
jgi:hypothetical protein